MNIKNFIIKKLGGYTEEDWDNFLKTRPLMPKFVTNLDLSTLRTRISFTKEEWDFLSSPEREDMLKATLLREISKHLDPFIQFTIYKSPVEESNTDVIAILQALRPKDGGVLHYGHH